MAKTSLTERLYLFLWHRYVDGLSAEVTAGKADLLEEEFLDHRARRSRYYCAAEQRLEENMTPEMFLRYARAAQLRLLASAVGSGDSAAAGVAARVLDAAPEAGEPTTITFVIQDADLAERVGDVARAASRARPGDEDGDLADLRPFAAASRPRAPSGVAPNRPTLVWPTHTPAAAVAIAKSYKPRP